MVVDQKEEFLQGTHDAEWEEDYDGGGWEGEAEEEDEMKNAVFNQMNFELEKVMKEAEDFKPECKLPAVPKSVDLEAVIDKLYPAAKGGLTASHVMAGYDRWVWAQGPRVATLLGEGTLAGHDHALTVLSRSVNHLVSPYPPPPPSLSPSLRPPPQQHAYGDALFDARKGLRLCRRPCRQGHAEQVPQASEQGAR